MFLTNPLVSNFNFMQLSQVPNKTISDKFILHIFANHNRSLPAAHHGEVCEDLSSVGSYRSPCFVYNFFRNVYFFFMGSDLMFLFTRLYRLRFTLYIFSIKMASESIPNCLQIIFFNFPHDVFPL